MSPLAPTPVVYLLPIILVVPSATDTDEHSAILQASLRFVPKFGWSAAALAEGAESLGLPHPSAEMFPRAGGKLVEYFERQSNQQLVAFLEQQAEEKQ